MKNHLGICLTVSILTFGMGIAYAQGGPGGPGHPHGRGPGGFLPPFSALDANADGKVTQEEFTTALNKRNAEMFKRFDADGDGVLSTNEMPKGRGPRPGQEGPPPAPPDGAPAAEAAPPAMPPEGPQKAGVRPPRPEEFDSDKDGKVTQEEFQAAFAKTSAARFCALDANGDKVLDEEELAKAKGPRDGRGRPGGGPYGGEADQH